jgi:dGTPase
MEQKKFFGYAADENNANYQKLISRENEMYSRPDDIRTPFSRDYTRILHSPAYRRLKHKTQVFYNAENDHICTRMEHVLHVESVSTTICAYLGLNTELARAIAVGHDLGHAPFGHCGEEIIDELSKKYLGRRFWHERNGLRRVDLLELLEDNYMVRRNLNLTYAVRDGIISHCGEVDENGLHPRSELMPLSDFESAGQYQSATWEGCVVKISDKIAYIGRDIEDACRLKFLDDEKVRELQKFAPSNGEKAVNTTVIIHNMILDICKNSSPEKGIMLSSEGRDRLDSIKAFNYENIYGNEKFNTFRLYSKLVINQIFEKLLSAYDDENTIAMLAKDGERYPVLCAEFGKWLLRYCNIRSSDEEEAEKISSSYANEKIYNKLETEEIYIRAIIDYISGMTDGYALKAFDELLKF